MDSSDKASLLSARSRDPPRLVGELIRERLAPEMWSARVLAEQVIFSGSFY
jgi:hypothetical protein